MTVPRKTLPQCPVECCIAAISGRWKAMIIWRLLERPLRYSEMSQRIPEMTERVLSQVLKELENDGIVERSSQKAWQLTALGQALKPSLNSMFTWGQLAQGVSPRPLAK
ncbi:winged helix-turn-helix transcriptional regulator [Gloeobacter morelensis]|uniref:Helix-turn-helix transcriptional regulator n=1 Tax=Gloeobacter morelensis MG652769 TaxID=2781736 RepID=A0ABY3PJS7_9CYAN|nr:helix-turn-helix transcriptional regulator [Gloeobacter morelensis MG652769]